MTCLRPASTSWRSIHRRRHDSEIPRSPATGATGFRCASRSRARRRNSSGFGTGMVDASWPNHRPDFVSGVAGEAPCVILRVRPELCSADEIVSTPSCASCSACSPSTRGIVLLPRRSPAHGPSEIVPPRGRSRAEARCQGSGSIHVERRCDGSPASRSDVRSWWWRCFKEQTGTAAAPGRRSGGQSPTRIPSDEELASSI